MTKSELIQRLAKKYPHLYLRDIEKIVNTVFGEITTALSTGRRVELRGFGAFSVRERTARTARNPRTGEQVTVGKRCPSKILRSNASPRNGSRKRLAVSPESSGQSPWQAPA